MPKSKTKKLKVPVEFPRISNDEMLNGVKYMLLHDKAALPTPEHIFATAEMLRRVHEANQQDIIAKATARAKQVEPFAVALLNDPAVQEAHAKAMLKLKTNHKENHQ